MKNNKGFASIIIVLIVVGVLVLGGGSYYFLTKKTPEPTEIPTLTPAPIPTATSTPTATPTSTPTPAESPTPTPTQGPVACTQEAKICPDGSSVGRIGLSCEFAECPTVKTSINDAKKNVLVIVDENYYAGLSPYLSEFKNDVKSNFEVNINILSINPNIYTSEKIRELLISECQIDPILGCKNLEGAIFVGDIPYAIYDSPYDLSSAPFMFYYQDLDATFNKKSNGNYDKYLTFGNHEGPEIYISWIKPIKDQTFGNYQEQLNNYFKKHHKYLSGETQATKKVLLATHCDITTAGSWSFMFENYYGKENIIEVYPKGRCDNLCPLKQDLLTQLSAMPEVARLHSHGTPTELWCLSKEDIKSLESQPALMASWGCGVGNFYNYESDSFPLAFINGKDLGLSFIGKLHAEDIDTSGEGSNFTNNDIYLFENWNKGDYLGKAFLDMEQSFTNKTFPPGDEQHPTSFSVNLYRVSGPLQRIIIGSPFVYQQTVSPAERLRAEALVPAEDVVPRAPTPKALRP